MVDDDDYDELNAAKWGVSSGYCYKSIGRAETISMYRVLMGLKKFDKMQVDHIDRNGLNNQRSNLRLATHSQNALNKPAGRNHPTGLKGILLPVATGLFVVRVKSKTVGQWGNLRDAVCQYNDEARKAHGEFALQHDYDCAALEDIERRLRA